MKESDMYAPLKAYLEGQGYEVKGEVKGCDAVAVRGDEPPVVVELKLQLNLALLLQAVDRLSISETVYVCVPKHLKVLKGRKQQRRLVKMLKMLGIGLIAVDLKTEARYIEIIVDPCEYTPKVSPKRRGRLLGEFTKRVGDPTPGGSDNSGKKMTVYRQRAIAIATHLRDEGPTKASDLATALGDPKARDLLYRDVYGWFDRQGKGIYAISPRGATELATWLDD